MKRAQKGRIAPWRGLIVHAGRPPRPSRKQNRSLKGQRLRETLWRSIKALPHILYIAVRFERQTPLPLPFTFQPPRKSVSSLKSVDEPSRRRSPRQRRQQLPIRRTFQRRQESKLLNESWPEGSAPSHARSDTFWSENGRFLRGDVKETVTKCQQYGTDPIAPHQTPHRRPLIPAQNLVQFLDTE